MALSPAIAARLAEIKARGEQQNGTQEQVRSSCAETTAGEQSGIVESSVVDLRLQSAQQSPERREGGVQEAQAVGGATNQQATAGSVTLAASDLIRHRISELKTALQKAIPGYERMLQIIHRELGADEELVHQLTEEEIGIICAGLAKRKNVVLVTAAAKSKSESKRLSTLSVDDI